MSNVCSSFAAFFAPPFPPDNVEGINIVMGGGGKAGIVPTVLTRILALYYSLIYPCIAYCNSTWSSAYVSNLKRILYLQKRAVQAIRNSDYRAYSAPIFAKLGIMDIFQ